MRWFPEVCPVRVVGSGDQNISIGLEIRWFRGVVKPQTVHVLQVKSEAAFLRINLKAYSVSAAYTEAAGLKRAQAAITKAHHRGHRVVHFASRDEGVLHR